MALVDIGGAIIRIRKAKGISQESLAFDASLSRNYMHKVEAGKASPTVKTLMKIAECLDVKVSDIVLEAE
jgi:transcriptional regulator with XRE-family HTH domain